MVLTPHGGDTFGAARRLGLHPSRILDFSASINPFGLSSKTRRRLKRELDLVCHYPDRRQGTLRYLIAQKEKIDPECIVFGNGATQLLHAIPRCLKPRKALLAVPSFPEYRATLSCQIKEFQLRAEEGFCLNPAAFLHTAERECPDLVVLANPNNPTGTLIPRGALLNIARSCAKFGATLVLDESFVDFAPEESLLRQASQQNHLVVVRSLTKFFALPGLRIGYLVARRSLAAKLAAQLEPWSVNTLALIAAAESLKDLNYRERSLALIRREREFLLKSLRRLGWLEPYPSVANFLLVRIKVSGLSGADLQRELAMHYILIRDRSGFRSLGSQYVRIAVRRRKENILLLNALRAVNDRLGLKGKN